MSTPNWVATVKEFQGYWFLDFGKDHEAAIGNLLGMSWPRIQLALNSSGQGNCTLADGMDVVLKELHIILAGVMLNIAGVRISPAQREMYAPMVTEQLRALAARDMVVCVGTTTSAIPASGRVINYG